MPKKLGIDVDNLLISQPDNGEQALEIADHLISSGAIDIIVIDSVAALVPKAEIEGDMGDSKVGLHARLMSQALRKLTGTINKTNCLVIFINQLREKIGVMFGSPETTTGGNALKFYASVRLDIRRIGQIKEDKDHVTGNRTKVKVVKNKVAPPFKVIEFDIMYGEGISKTGEIIDLGTELGIIVKSGSWFSYDGNRIGQGRESVVNLLRDNPEMADQIEAKIRAKVKGGDAALPEDRNVDAHGADADSPDEGLSYRTAKRPLRPVRWGEAGASRYVTRTLPKRPPLPGWPFLRAPDLWGAGAVHGRPLAPALSRGACCSDLTLPTAPGPPYAPHLANKPAFLAHLGFPADPDRRAARRRPGPHL